jgi:hypothetical protein
MSRVSFQIESPVLHEKAVRRAVRKVVKKAAGAPCMSMLLTAFPTALSLSLS